MERYVMRGPCLGCQNSKNQEKGYVFFRLNKKYVLRVYFLLTLKYVIRVVLVCSLPS